MEKISLLLSKWKTIQSIEVVSDFAITEPSGIIVIDKEMGITKAVFKELTKYSIMEMEHNPEKASIVGCLIGSHDERFFVYRSKLTDFCFEDEVLLCHIGLTVNPKCVGAFFRLRQLFTNFKITESFIQKEIEFCNFLTAKKARNYNLWMHRLWLFNTYHLGSDEFEWVRNWTRKHPSDYSAFSYMQEIMPTDENTLKEELKVNTQMIFEYPGHESLWNQRKFLLKKINLEKPENWKKIPILEKNVEYPEVILASKVTDAYYDLCSLYGIKLNLVMDSEENVGFYNEKLESEDFLVQVALSDDYPTEFKRQMSSAKKFYHWIHSVL